jgi:hypothetical protein
MNQENHPFGWGGFSYGNAESQNRTGDTLIFSQVLYQLSYLGSLRWIVLVALDDVKKEGVGVGLGIFGKRRPFLELIPEDSHYQIFVYLLHKPPHSRQGGHPEWGKGWG